MNRLTQIANECQTDKGFNKDECHGYTEHYEHWLSQYKSPKILEIGAWHGASTKMFNEYYDHNCEIWTYDISYNAYWYEDQPNVHKFTGDQGNVNHWSKFLEEAGTKFDIIIDDGSHEPKHQIKTLFWLHKQLNYNGIYILEDLHTWHWDKTTNSPLYLLNFWNNDNEYLSKDQYDELKEAIKDETIIHIKNPNNQYGGFSITSILHLKWNGDTLPLLK